MVILNISEHINSERYSMISSGKYQLEMSREKDRCAILTQIESIVLYSMVLYYFMVHFYSNRDPRLSLQFIEDHHLSHISLYFSLLHCTPPPLVEDPCFRTNSLRNKMAHNIIIKKIRRLLVMNQFIKICTALF